MSIVQTGCGHNLGSIVSLTFADPVAAGNRLVAWLVARAEANLTPPVGWALIAGVAIDSGGSAAAMYHKLADSGDAGDTSFAFNVPAGSSRPKILGWELSNTGAPTASVSTTNGSGTSFSLPALTVGTGIAIVGIGTGSDIPEPATVTPSDHIYVEAGDHFWQTAVGADDTTTPGSIAYAATFTVSGGGALHCGVAAFFPASDAPVPEPGAL